MVAQVVLVHSVQVRVLAGLPFYFNKNATDRTRGASAPQSECSAEPARVRQAKPEHEQREGSPGGVAILRVAPAGRWSAVALPGSRASTNAMPIQKALPLRTLTDTYGRQAQDILCAMIL